VWSQRFAEDIARALECSDEGVVTELAETFRHLPPEKIQWARDFASFLRGQAPSGTTGPALAGWLTAKLREVLDFAVFLRGRYGYEQPVEESDTWTEEDERDATLAALRRREEGAR
jgi:hypothetical protein